ncbi:MAG TPA: DUF6263 family protein [Gemmatimonadaceae bacterium]|nr:DUF6263 family protein [Gemmatimonadaceae bacterium]
MGSRRGRGARRVACGIAAALCAMASMLGAQTAQASRAAPGTPPSRAHALIALRIHPRVGDTLYTRFEQSVDMEGTARVGASDTTMRSSSTLLLLAHVFVQGSDEQGTTVTTITDSVEVGGAGPATELVRRALQGKKVQLRIAPDGSAVVLESQAAIASDMQAVVSGVPATLPSQAVAVGESWEKAMSIPVAGREVSSRPATLRARYRLDSLSSDGAIAYISMRGTITRDPAPELPERIRITSSGTIEGSMQVDRRRGWWCDSRATIRLESVVTMFDASRPPMRVTTRIDQRMGTWTPR